MTAAHKSLPFGSKVKVTNKKNGHAVTVTITDRGPYVKGRCIDLSKALQVGNALDLPYSDQTFDVVWCQNVAMDSRTPSPDQGGSTTRSISTADFLSHVDQLG